MDLQRINLESRDKPRNVGRLVIHVASSAVNGSMVQGYRIPREGAKVEIYVDRLPLVLERVRTQAHRDAYQRARETYQHLRAEWIKEHQRAYDKKPEHERERWVDLKLNIRPEHELHRLKQKMPALEYCLVEHPQTGDTMDAFEWQKLPAEQRAGWLVEPPVTTENAAARSNAAVEQLAALVTRSLVGQQQSKK